MAYSIEFKYSVDDRVTTPFGDAGIIEMLGFDEGGKKYYVRTKLDGSWFKEADLRLGDGEKLLTEAR
jgi:hypothetical protein